MSITKIIESGRGWKLFGVIGLIALLMYFLPDMTGLQSWLIVILGVLTTGASILSYRTLHPVPRLAWLAFILTQVLNLAGDFVGRLNSLVINVSFLNPVPDILYTLANVLLLIGAPLLFWYYRHLFRRQVIPQGLIIGIGFALLVWITVISPNLAVAPPASAWFNSLVKPAGVVVIAFLSTLFLMTPLGNAWCFRFLFGTLFFQQIGAYVFDLLPSSQATNASDLLSSIALVLLGLAFLHPSIGTLNKLTSNSTSIFSPLDMLTLALGFSVAPVALLVQSAVQLPFNVVVVIVGMLVVFALIEWRLSILLRLLRAQNEQLLSLDKLKSQFLANMSHELRSPLNSIINFSQFTQSGMYGTVTDEQREAMTRISSSGEHLLSMINDILDFAKVQADMVKLFVERDVSLQTELETAASVAEGLLVDKPVTLVREIPASLPLMVGDRRRIRQVFINLLSNACKFTKEGQVVLSAEAHDSQILVSVKDTGPGIPIEDQTLIFEPFRQSNAGLEEGKGTGLGLPLARSFVQAHHGKMWLESKVGVGTTFHVSLPIRSPELERMA